MESSKTPQFDGLLDTILDGIVPHLRICKQKEVSKFCEGEFQIEAIDIDFYKMLRVPPPMLCPTCRRQQRFAFVNRTAFYKRINNAPGATGTIISYVPPKSPLIIYDYDYYRSDKWEPTTYVQNYDVGSAFFDQLYNLRLQVPQPALLKDPSNINYEYSLNGRNSKDVYCSSGIFDSENVWYSVFATKSSNIMDSNKAPHDDNCSYLVNSENCSFCHHIYFSKDCINCRFSYDLRNCQDCFSCVNLRNKRYCFFNEQLTKEEYEKRLSDLELDQRSKLQLAEEKFWQFIKANPVLASRSSRSVDSTGVLLTNCKDCTNCVSAEKSEHERYGDSVIGHRDSMDNYASGGSELLYQCSGSGSDCANSKFLVISKFITHSEYLINCRNCQFCFGSIGLENKKYCIFNKQYESNEYFIELDKIKSELIRRGEYGEFFPYRFSAFAYNGADVDYVYPLDEQEIEKIGGLYQENIESDLTGLSTIEAKDLPDSIHDVDDTILTKAIICKETGRPFRIIASELAFYRKHGLPLPTVHPYKRTKDMFKYTGNHLKYDGVCESCGTLLQTIYKSDQGFRLYCEACFQREVI